MAERPHTLLWSQLSLYSCRHSALSGRDERVELPGELQERQVLSPACLVIYPYYDPEYYNSSLGLSTRRVRWWRYNLFTLVRRRNNFPNTFPVTFNRYGLVRLGLALLYAV
jgi:hypothetical protein